MIIHNLNVIPNLRNGRLPLNSNINTVSGSSGGGGGGSVSPETIISVVKPYLDLKLDISVYALDISTLSALINTKVDTSTFNDTIATINSSLSTKAPIDSPNFTGTPTINNNVIYHAGNANSTTVDWTAKKLISYGGISMPNNNNWSYITNPSTNGGIKFSTADASGFLTDALDITSGGNYIKSYLPLYLTGNTAGSRYIYMNNPINTHRITSTAVGKFVIARDGIKNDFILDENGNVTLYGTTTSIGDLNSYSNINASNTINASSNITSGATIQCNKVISRGVVKSEGRGVAGYVGNWGGSSYYGLGEDTTASWIKLSGCDADGIWNSTPVNLKISGSTQIGQTLQSSSYSGTGFSASGWGVDSDGNMNIKSLTVRELARFYELEIAKIRAVNGGLAVTPADGKITSIDSSNNKLYFKDADSLGFVVGDIVRAQKWDGGVRGFKAPVVAIDTVNKSITLGTFIIGDFSQIKVGDDVIVWDSTVAGRDGLIYMSANDSGSPFVDIIKKQATKLRIGNIGNMSWNGTNIPANTLGYWADGDVYINNGFFKGRIEVTGGNVPTTAVIDLINASIGTINSSISTVNSSISGINTNITNLNSSVNTATNTANTANSTANTANTNANTAISTANTAKSGVDSLNTWKGTIGTLAYQNAVSAAMCDTTLISGGYIKTSLLNANEIFAKQATIGGWNLVADSIDSTNGRMRIHNGVTSVFVSKPSGGHVMLGQTYINGAWTGQYGISATNAYSQELFRLDDDINRIAGWNFDSYHLYSGYMSLNANGSIEHTGGKWALNNNGSGKLAGGNITWDDAGNATFNGTVNASAGNFTGKINADSGRFGNIGGGVNITGYGLQSDVFNNRYSVMGLGVTFGICKENHDVENGFRFDGSGKLAGGNITWTNAPDYTVNIKGTITNATNAVNAVNANNASNLNGISADNYVRYNNGNILSNKIVAGKGVTFMNFTAGAPTISRVSINESLVFVVSNYSNTDSCYLEMPSLSDIRNNLGIGVGVKFQIVIKVIAKYDTPRLFYVGYDNTEYQIRDYNGGLSSFKLSGGDSIEIIIISDGINTWGQTTGLLR